MYINSTLTIIYLLNNFILYVYVYVTMGNDFLYKCLRTKRRNEMHSI